MPERTLDLYRDAPEADRVRILEGTDVMLTQEGAVPDDYNPLDHAPFCQHCDALLPSWDSICACSRGMSFYQDDEYR